MACAIDFNCPLCSYGHRNTHCDSVIPAPETSDHCASTTLPLPAGYITGLRTLTAYTALIQKAAPPNGRFVKLSAARSSTTGLGSMYKYGIFYPSQTTVICWPQIARDYEYLFSRMDSFCISRPEPALRFVRLNNFVVFIIVLFLSFPLL